jgi:hypothetical protein
MRHDVGHSRVPSPPSSPRSLHTPFGVASRCIIIIAMKVAKASAHPQEHTSSHTLTYHWDQILPWQQDNHYIRSGYRPQSNSYLQSGYSLAYLHNETVNIYTHLIGAILTLVSSGALYHVLGSRYDTASREDVWVFCCLFLGALSCLGMSATFHTISNHSHDVARWGNQLDYAGIVFLIWGSFIPVLYYGFQDDPRLMQTYWGMVSRRVCRRRMTCSRGQITTLGACTATISLHPDFRTSATSISHFHVRPHGFVSRDSRAARCASLRCRASTQFCRSGLGHCSRRLVHSWRRHLRCARPREMEPRYVRHLGLESPDLSCSCCRCGCGTSCWGGEGI